MPLSSVTVRRPLAILGVPSSGLCLIAITVCRIEARPVSRSRSDQRKPNASPRRMPDVASRRYARQYLIVSDERTFARIPVGVNEVANVGKRSALRCCRSPGEQVASPRAELLDGLRGSAGDFLDRGGHAVIPILAM